MKTPDDYSNAVARDFLTSDESEWIHGEALCGCDGIPCRLNRTVEDGEAVCGSCELPCHSVERYGVDE